MASRRIGVLIGPTPKGDGDGALNSIFDSFSFKRVKPSNCHLIPISSDLPFIAVEVDGFDGASELSDFSQMAYEYKEKLLKISMTSIYDGVGDNLLSFYEQIPNFIDGNELNLLNLHEKVPRTLKLTFPPNLSTVLFLAEVYAEDNGIELEYVNLSNSEIKSTKGFKIFAYLFRNVKKVNLSGNLFDKEDFLSNETYLFPNIKIILDDPDLKDTKIKNNKKDAFSGDFVDSEQEKGIENDIIRPPPNYVMYSIPPKPQVTLDDFDSVNLDVGNPIHCFIYRLFSMLWNGIYELSSFFVQDAIFSISIQESYHYTEYFKYVKQNLKTENNLNNQFQGIENIKEILNFYFQGGFKSKPTSIITKKLNDMIYSIIVIGVFEINDTIYGFHHSLFLRESNNNYFITNDHLYICEPY